METTQPIRTSPSPAAEPEDSGQAAVALVLMLSLFLLGILGFAVDITNLLFHRQAAQAAADAACLAGAMDLQTVNGGLIPVLGFAVGTNSNCVQTPAASICAYAGFNGYTGSGLTANAVSNSVSWTFASGLSGLLSTIAGGSATNSFLTVTVSENVRTYLMSLLSASHFQNVTVSTTCGLAQVKTAAPMLVLNPNVSGAFTYYGGGTLDIVGGPSRGLQVNSSSTTAVLWGASGAINLSAGGPNQTGSSVGVVGGPTTAPGGSTGFNGGTTGTWQSGVIPIADPFGSVGVPASIAFITPSTSILGSWVAYKTDNCPDHTNSTGNPLHACKEFAPGYYPLGINLPLIMNNYSTAIFQPGIYYLNGSLIASGTNTLRVAKPSGYQQTDGVMFYFLAGSTNISGCSGCSNSNIDNVAATDLTCDGSSPASALGMSSTVFGNVLYGQCATNGTYFDSGGDTSDSRGTPGSRGLVVFQDHLNVTQPILAGSGSLSFSGALYFHSSLYTDVFSLSGGASSGTYVLGNIVSDEISLSGSGVIKLALNGAATTNMSKVSLLQ